MESLMAICDRVIAELERKAAVPVTQEAQPRPAVSPSRTPVQVETVSTVPADSPTVEPLEPSPVRPADHPVPCDPVRESIRALVEYANRTGRGEIGSYIQDHPAQWGSFAFEYSGMIDQLSETRPGADAALVSDLAAQAVLSWIDLDFLKRIDGPEYRARMHGAGGIWDRLKRGATA